MRAAQQHVLVTYLSHRGFPGHYSLVKQPLNAIDYITYWMFYNVF